MTENKHNEEKLKSMSLGDHLDELRARLILGIIGLGTAFIISLVASKHFLVIVLSPYEAAMKELNTELSLQAIDVAEPFLVYLKATMVLGIIISSPWLFYQIWAFVSAGLYAHERRFVKMVVPASAALFIAGVILFLFIIAPWVFKFLIKFNLGVDYLRYQPSIAKYISFVFTLTLVFGLAFQSPIAIIFSERMGLVTVETLASARKYILLGCFVFSAMVTPPDPVSQISLAFPLYLLYEGSMIVCRIWKRKRQK